MLFHPGELWVQQKLGLSETVAAWAARAIRTRMPDLHRAMFGTLPFVVVAARDARQRTWATLLTGPPGFIQSPSDTSLQLTAQPFIGDALEQGFNADAEIGLLGIDLNRKGRIRANGIVTGNSDGVISIAVHQSYGNCPKYIRQRAWQPVTDSASNGVIHRADALDRATAAWIRRADTFFISSGYTQGLSPPGGLDASHRGGEPGLVEVPGNREMLFPDYAGNSFFNTLGNLVENPDIGLLFVDFERGSLLQINGRAQIDWDSPEVALRPGAQRLVRVAVKAVLVLENILPIHW